MSTIEASDHSRDSAGATNDSAASFPVHRFVAVFLVLVVTLFLLIELTDHLVSYRGYCALTARIVARTLQAIGFNCTAAGAIVTCSAFKVTIVPECLALAAMAIYTAGVVAYSAPLRHKIVGLAAGLGVIWVANVVRLAMLVAVGSRFSRETFHAMHAYMWQTSLIVLVCLTWLVWLKKVPAK